MLCWENLVDFLLLSLIYNVYGHTRTVAESRPHQTTDNWYAGSILINTLFIQRWFRIHRIWNWLTCRFDWNLFLLKFHCTNHENGLKVDVVLGLTPRWQVASMMARFLKMILMDKFKFSEGRMYFSSQISTKKLLKKKSIAFSLQILDRSGSFHFGASCFQRDSIINHLTQPIDDNMERWES